MKQLNDINPNLSKILPRIFFSLIPVLLLSFFLSSELLSNTSAERINVNIGDGAYYMNITADDLDIDIDATPAGVTESVQKDIVVSTNSGTGYKLYLSMNNNETNGNRLYYNGDKTNTNYIIPTSSSSLSTNSWGYSTDGSSFSAVPLQGNEAVIGQSATSPSSPVTHSVYYGFNVNNTLPFGSYSGVVTYTAVADAAASPTAHTSVANYLDDKSMADPAGGDTLVITTSLMTNMANIGDVTVSVGGTNCPVTGTSTASKFAEVQCTMPAKSAGSYAVAVTFAKFSKTYNTTISYYDSGLSFGAGMNKIRTMQGMTADVCKSMATPAAFTADSSGNPTTTFNTNVPDGFLRDTRDTNSYYVRKLADGNCWMMQNLNLDFGTPSNSSSYVANTDFTLTNIDTDLNSKASWMPEFVTQTRSSSSLNWGEDDINRAHSFTFGSGGSYPERYWNGSSNYTTTKPSDPVVAAIRMMGNYYNAWAVTAGSVINAAIGTDAPDSICPKGWRLPPVTGDKSTTNLIVNIYNISNWASTDASLIAAPLSFARTGSYMGGISEQGTWGVFQGSTRLTENYLSRLAFQSSGAQDLTTTATKFPGPGYPARCVAR